MTTASANPAVAQLKLPLTSKKDERRITASDCPHPLRGVEPVPERRRTICEVREVVSRDKDTVGYNFVSDFATTGWRNCSRDYSR